MNDEKKRPRTLIWLLCCLMTCAIGQLADFSAACGIFSSRSIFVENLQHYHLKVLSVRSHAQWDTIRRIPETLRPGRCNQHQRAETLSQNTSVGSLSTPSERLNIDDNIIEQAIPQTDVDKLLNRKLQSREVFPRNDLSEEVLRNPKVLINFRIFLQNFQS